MSPISLEYAVVISNDRNSSSSNRPNTYDSELKFGFKEIKSPNFWEFKLIWQNSHSDFSMHLIERNRTYQLPEGPCSATSPVADLSHLPRGHHIYFSVSNFKFVQTLRRTILCNKIATPDP